MTRICRDCFDEFEGGKRRLYCNICTARRRKMARRACPDHSHLKPDTSQQKMRRCLQCARMFLSNGPGYRFCGCPRPPVSFVGIARARALPRGRKSRQYAQDDSQ